MTSQSVALASENKFINQLSEHVGSGSHTQRVALQHAFKREDPFPQLRDGTGVVQCCGQECFDGRRMGGSEGLGQNRQLSSKAGRADSRAPRF
jgi:hypothetical protein